MNRHTCRLPLMICVLLALLLPAGPAAARSEDDPARIACNVISFGAKADGRTRDTAAIQRAIDTCAGRGGGTVHFSAGTYLSGSLHLRSNVTLRLDNGAILKGSPDQADYDPYEQLDFKNAADNETSYFHHALIWGEDIENIAVTGHGTIDGNRQKRGGPKPIALKRCRNVSITGITIRNAPNYNISLLGTDNVIIDGVTILNGYCDGIDPDACRNVSISNCHIESWDDAIVPKASFSLGERRSVENLTVTNCRLATGCNAFKLGTESGGDFKRIAVSNCVMFRFQNQRPAISGIAIESVDGSNIDGVVVSNITMVDVRAPIFIRLGNRGRDMPVPIPGSLKNVLISNVVAAGASLASSITGIPGHPVQGVTLSNIRMTVHPGDPDGKFCDDVPEVVAKYPDADMFGCLPAYGLYCRHAEDLTLANVQILYDSAARWHVTGDTRRTREWVSATQPASVAPSGPLAPALVCDDIRQLRIDGLSAQPMTNLASAAATKPSATALVQLVNVRDALLRGCVAPRNTDVYLQIRGADTSAITLIANDFLRARRAVLASDGAPDSEITSLANPAP